MSDSSIYSAGTVLKFVEYYDARTPKRESLFTFLPSTMLRKRHSFRKIT
jgi:hypothetical protein